MEFYDYVFPSTNKVGPKSNQDAFTEYGCVEAVNLEFDNEKVHFTAKKEKSLLHTLDTDVHRIFVPSQDVHPLGKPNQVDILFHKPGIADLYQDRCVINEAGKRQVEVVSNVEQQIHNLLTDHPDAYHGTALKEYSHLFPYSITQDCYYEPAEEEYMATRQTKKLLNPSHLDIPRNVLNEHLLEEAVLQTQNMNYNADYTGGCIDYVDMGPSKYGSSGVLMYPQGSAMDAVEFQIVNIKAKKTDDFVSPQLETGSKIRWKLNGTVLQTCTSSPSDRPDISMFGARTHNGALIASLTKDQIHFIDEDTSRSTFTDCNSINACGAFQSTSTISSLDLNPYMAGESVVALYNGSVYAWNSTSEQNVNDKDASRGLQRLNFSETDTLCDQWSQVVYAAHPHQIYLAKRSEVNVIDMRFRSPSPSKVLCLPHNNENEKIMTILPGSSFHQNSYENTQHIFQCLVATQYNLLLMDQRYNKEPLLQWSLCMRKPCQHLAAVNMQDENNNISLVVAANQMPQQLHSFQFKMEKSTQKPPVATCVPRSLGSFTTIKRSLSQVPVPRHNSYLQRRLSQPVVGITAFSHENSAVVIQISECGDVIYQPLILNDVTQVSDEGSFTTGLPSSLFYSEKAKKQEKISQDIYRQWACDMISYGKDEFETSRGISATRFSVASLGSRIKAELMGTKQSQCLICNSVCFLCGPTVNSTSPASQQQDENSDCSDSTNQYICQTCSNHFEFSGDLLHAHETGVHPTQNRRAKLDSTYTDTECEVQDLHLINTDGATDLGVVLVSTWDNTYEQLWTKLEAHRLKEEKEGERKAALSVRDMPSEQITMEGDGNSVDRSEKLTKTPVKTVDKPNDLPTALSIPKTPLVTMSNISEDNVFSKGLAKSSPTASPRRKQVKPYTPNSPFKASQKSSRKKSMIGFT
uniref:Uncharacterized protein LOC100184347 n=1 Tax=Phallusia mammillata TaxID=59560 RepID=A0A6F9DIL6_9ASCI|nr:uncharacterized protein LOC100184347 [Phallusia mammillata]